MNQPLPLDADDLYALSSLATRIEYPRQGKTHAVWAAERPLRGWWIITDRGNPGDEHVMISFRTRVHCLSAMSTFMGLPGAVAVEWETER